MSKAWAKINVWYGLNGWALQLYSDVGWCNLLQNGESRADALAFPSKAAAIARARAWSRRLGGLAVEVEE